MTLSLAAQGLFSALKNFDPASLASYLKFHEVDSRHIREVLVYILTEKAESAGAERKQGYLAGPDFTVNAQTNIFSGIMLYHQEMGENSPLVGEDAQVTVEVEGGNEQTMPFLTYLLQQLIKNPTIGYYRDLSGNLKRNQEFFIRELISAGAEVKNSGDQITGITPDQVENLITGGKAFFDEFGVIKKQFTFESKALREEGASAVRTQFSNGLIDKKEAKKAIEAYEGPGDTIYEKIQSYMNTMTVVLANGGQLTDEQRERFNGDITEFLAVIKKEKANCERKRKTCESIVKKNKKKTQKLYAKNEDQRSQKEKDYLEKISKLTDYIKYAETQEKLCKDILTVAKPLLRLSKDFYTKHQTDLDAGMTPLEIACRSMDAKMVTFLLMHGADPNAIPKHASGNFPVHYLAQAVRAEIVAIQDNRKLSAAKKRAAISKVQQKALAVADILMAHGVKTGQLNTTQPQQTPFNLLGDGLQLGTLGLEPLVRVISGTQVSGFEGKMGLNQRSARIKEIAITNLMARRLLLSDLKNLNNLHGSRQEDQLELFETQNVHGEARNVIELLLDPEFVADNFVALESNADFLAIFKHLSPQIMNPEHKHPNNGESVLETLFSSRLQDDFVVKLIAEGRLRSVLSRMDSGQIQRLVVAAGKGGNIILMREIYQIGKSLGVDMDAQKDAMLNDIIASNNHDQTRDCMAYLISEGARPNTWDGLGLDGLQQLANLYDQNWILSKKPASLLQYAVDRYAANQNRGNAEAVFNLLLNAHAELIFDSNNVRDQAGEFVDLYAYVAAKAPALMVNAALHDYRKQNVSQTNIGKGAAKYREAALNSLMQRYENGDRSTQIEKGIIALLAAGTSLPKRGEPAIRLTYDTLHDCFKNDTLLGRLFDFKCKDGKSNEPILVAMCASDKSNTEKIALIRAVLDKIGKEFINKEWGDDGYGETALSVTSRQLDPQGGRKTGVKHEDVIELLQFLSSIGAETLPIHARQFTPVENAVRYGEGDELLNTLKFGDSTKLRLDKCDVARTGISPFLLAAQAGNVAAMKKLLSEGADIHQDQPVKGNVLSVIVSEHTSLRKEFDDNRKKLKKAKGRKKAELAQNEQRIKAKLLKLGHAVKCLYANGFKGELPKKFSAKLELQGRSDEFKKMYAYSRKQDVRDSGLLPIQYAMTQGKYGMVRRFAKAGANLNETYEDPIHPNHQNTEITVLEAALRRGWTKTTAPLLIRMGADISKVDPAELTKALRKAVTNKNVELLEALLVNGADVVSLGRSKNFRNLCRGNARLGRIAGFLGENYTTRGEANQNLLPLSFALQQNNIDIAVDLIAAGAHFNDDDLGTQHANALLQRAINQNETDVVRKLLQTDFTTALDIDQALSVAIGRQDEQDNLIPNPEVVKLLLHAGADPNHLAQGIIWANVLNLENQQDAQAIAIAFIESSIEIPSIYPAMNGEAVAHEPFFHGLVMQGQLDVAMALVKRRSALNDVSQQTGAHSLDVVINAMAGARTYTQLNQLSEMADFMIQQGTDVNAANTVNGWTPLHLAIHHISQVQDSAIKKKLFELAHTLVQQGEENGLTADVLGNDQLKRTPLNRVIERLRYADPATRKGLLALTGAMIQKNPTIVNTASNDKAPMHLLIEQLKAVDERIKQTSGKKAKRSLEAVRKDLLALADTLMNTEGFDASQIHPVTGQPVLHAAINAEQEEIALKLIENASAEQLNYKNDDWTQEVAAQEEGQEAQMVPRPVLTPLHYAAFKKNKKIVEKLLDNTGIEAWKEAKVHDAVKTPSCSGLSRSRPVEDEGLSDHAAYDMRTTKEIAKAIIKAAGVEGSISRAVKNAQYHYAHPEGEGMGR